MRLEDGNGQPHQCESNKHYVQQMLTSSLVEMFPNLNHVQVESFVLKMFNSVYEWASFKSTLRDLLISMK